MARHAGVPSLRSVWGFVRPDANASGAAIQVASLRLAADPRGGGLHVSWDRNLLSGRAGISGEMRVKDGAAERSLPLDGTLLRDGSLLYMPQSSTVAFRLEVRDASGWWSRDSVTLRDVMSSTAPPSGSSPELKAKTLAAPAALPEFSPPLAPVTPDFHLPVAGVERIVQPPVVEVLTKRPDPDAPPQSTARPTRGARLELPSLR